MYAMMDAFLVLTSNIVCIQNELGQHTIRLACYPLLDTNKWVIKCACMCMYTYMSEGQAKKFEVNEQKIEKTNRMRKICV